MILNLLQSVQTLASDDSITHWVLGSGMIIAIASAAVSFGSMKADARNNRQSLKDHEEMDDNRFKSFDKRLLEISDDTRAIRSYMDEQVGYQRGLKEGAKKNGI